MNERDCIYAAALFDSHGSVTLDDAGRLSYAACFPGSIIAWMHPRWGGAVTALRSSYRLRLRSKACVVFVHDVAPFVVRRRAVVDAVGCYGVLQKFEVAARLRKAASDEALSDELLLVQLRHQMGKHG